MRKIIEKLVREHWNYKLDWNKGFTEKDMVDWIMTFANDIAASWLEIYLEKLKEEQS